MARRTRPAAVRPGPLIGLAALAATAACLHAHLPFAAPLWAGALAVALCTRPVALTGPKGPDGLPGPATPTQAARARLASWARAAGPRIGLPNRAWIDAGRLSWWAAAGAAAATAAVRSDGALTIEPDQIRISLASWWWTGPVCILALLTGIAWTAHTGSRPAQPRPALTLTDLTGPCLAVAALAGAAGAAAGAAVQAWTGSNWWQPSRAGLLPAGCALTAGALAAHATASRTALRPWRDRARAADQWARAFATVAPRLPAPRLTGHQAFGDLHVDTLDLAGGLEAAAVIALQPKLATCTPPGWETHVVHAWARRPDGSPLPGTASTTTVHILTCPTGHTPDLTRPDLDPDQITAAVSLLLSRAQAAWLTGRVDPHQRMIPGQPAAVHTPQSPTGLWAVPVRHAAGETALATLAAYYGPHLTRFSGCQALPAPALDAILIGSFHADPDTACPALAAMAEQVQQPAPTPQTLTMFLDQMDQDAAWQRRWASIKQTANIIPEAQWPLFRTGRLANGARMFHLPFVTLNGQPPEAMLGLEKKLAATLQGSPFASVTRFHDAHGRRGESHSQGFVVCWAAPGRRPWSCIADIVPAPRPTARPGPQAWLIAGLINQAFDAARLTRPELIDARPVADPTARRHLWQATLRLYGGVTVHDLTRKLPTIQACLAAPWAGVRPGPGDGEATVYAGIHPSHARIDDEETRRTLADVHWRQVFSAAGAASATGQTPTTLAVDKLATNQAIDRTVFTLPAGLGVTDVRRRAERIASGSGNHFIDIAPDPDDATRMILLSSPTDPLPETAPYDFAYQDAHTHTVALGTGVDGTPITWDPATDPHLMLIGLTGSGKALAAPTPVATPHGPRPLADLTVGQECLDETGQPARIVSTSPWTRARLWRLTFADGTTVDCDARHLWQVTTGQTRPTLPCRPDTLRHAQRLLETYSGHLATLETIATMIGCPTRHLTGLPAAAHTALHTSDTPARLYSADDLLTHLRAHPRRLGDYDMTDDHLTWLGIDGLWLDQAALTATLTPTPCPQAVDALIAHAAPRSRPGRARRPVRLYPVDEIAHAYLKAAAGPGYACQVLDTAALSHMDRAAVLVDGRPLQVTDVRDTGRDGPVRCLRLDNPSHLFALEGGIPTHNSAAIQAVIYGCLANDWDVAVGDAAKGGADFLPFAPHLSGFATQPQRAWIAALLGAVTDEVARRVRLTLGYGVARAADLPEEVRPRRLVVILDEFTSLINVARPRALAVGASAAARAAHAAAAAEYEAVGLIGRAVADIGAQARSAGVSLILVGQQIKAADLKNLPGGAGIRSNMSRILLGKATDGDRMAALRQPGQAPDPGGRIPPGRGVIEPVSRPAGLIQFWYTPDPADAYPRQVQTRRSRGPARLDYTPDPALLEPSWEGKELAEPAAAEDPMRLTLDELLTPPTDPDPDPDPEAEG